MSESPKLNLWQKLVEIRKLVTYLQKENEGAQYKYVSSSQVLLAVRSKMDELGVLIIPRITDHKVGESAIEYFDKENRPTKRTTTYFTELDMSMTWVNAESPTETIECPWYAQGVDIAGEKGVGKALTYGEKYFILRQFNIPTDADDPDIIQHGPRNESYTPPVGARKADSTNDLTAIEQASQQTVAAASEISEGQLKMLYAKSQAAGFQMNEKDKLMARVGAFLGYAVQGFENVKRQDVTRLAQYLDKQKKAS